MATTLWQYKDASGATHYVGAASEQEAMAAAGVSSVSPVGGFSSDKATQVGLDATQIEQLKANPATAEAAAAYKPSTAVLDKPATPSMVTEAVAGNTPEVTFDPTQAAERINNFNAALNVAVDEARKQRQDATLDLVGGLVPPGALPATSFAGVLEAFNADSRPLESALVSEASAFARDQEDRKFAAAETARIQAEDQKNAIRDLALSVAQNGGNEESVKAIMALVESGDIDQAVQVAASSYSGSKDIRQLGNQLVEVYKDDNGEMQTRVLFDGSSYSGGSSSPSSSNVSNPPKSDVRVLPFGAQGAPTEVPYVDYNDTSVDMQIVEATIEQYMPEISGKVLSSLKAKLTRAFLTDWLETVENFGYIPADQFFKDWMQEKGLPIIEPKQAATKTETKPQTVDEVLGIEGD